MSPSDISMSQGKLERTSFQCWVRMNCGAYGILNLVTLPLQAQSEVTVLAPLIISVLHPPLIMRRVKVFGNGTVFRISNLHISSFYLSGGGADPCSATCSSQQVFQRHLYLQMTLSLRQVVLAPFQEILPLSPELFKRLISPLLFCLCRSASATAIEGAKVKCFSGWRNGFVLWSSKSCPCVCCTWCVQNKKNTKRDACALENTLLLWSSCWFASPVDSLFNHVD